MKRPYYLFSNGRLRRKQNTLFLERAANERSPGDDPFDTGLPSSEPTGDRVPFPVEQVEAIYTFGEVDINTKLITFLAQNSVPVHFFDYYGNYTATMYPRDYLHSGRLRVAQVKHYLQSKKRIYLARRFVEAAGYNIQRVLKYYIPRLKGDAATLVEDISAAVRHERRRVKGATAIPDLMGIEGRIRDLYYDAWPAILGDGAGRAFSFEHRRRRPPSNEMNALISFGNAMAYTATLRQIYRTALDPTISYLHEPGDRRFSLALDLSEIFKPLLVDRAIFRLVKTGEISPKHFEPRLGGVYLKDAGRKIFVEHWDARMKQTIQHRVLERKVSYERLIRLDCYRLIRHLLDPKNEPFEGFKMWW